MGKAVRFRAAVHVNDYLPLSRRDATRFDGAARPGSWPWKRPASRSRTSRSPRCTIASPSPSCSPTRRWAWRHRARARARSWTAPTGPEGRLPINRSGGLKAKGHPVGATGVSMHAIARCSSPARPGAMQLKRAELGGVFNMGGAAVANYVSILDRYADSKRSSR